jgi:hypothetical protein
MGHGTNTEVYQAPLVKPVGAQFIGAPPIYRPVERIDGLLADKSAVRA